MQHTKLRGVVRRLQNRLKTAAVNTWRQTAAALAAEAREVEQKLQDSEPVRGLGFRV